METAAPGSFESSFISGHPSKYTVTSDCACLEKPKKNPENSTSEKEVCLVCFERKAPKFTAVFL